MPRLGCAAPVGSLSSRQRAGIGHVPFGEPGRLGASWGPRAAPREGRGSGRGLATPSNPRSSGGLPVPFLQITQASDFAPGLPCPPRGRSPPAPVDTTIAHLRGRRPPAPGNTTSTTSTTLTSYFTATKCVVPSSCWPRSLKVGACDPAHQTTPPPPPTPRRRLFHASSTTTGAVSG